MAIPGFVLVLSAWTFIQAGYGSTETTGDTTSRVITANQDFAFTLYKKLAAQATNQGKNIFCSPASVSLALAALSVGAAGETQQHIFNALGFSKSHLTQAEVNEAFHTLLTERASDNTVDEGTAVFVDNQFQAKPEFLAELKRSYLSDGFNIDFKNAKESVSAINQYASDKTGGKIDEMVTDVDPETVMFLMSFIYYRGRWEIPFITWQTAERPFHVDRNTEVQVNMMQMRERLDYYHDQAINTTIVQLRFTTSFVMLFCLPDDMELLESTISQAQITKWMKWKELKKIMVRIPRHSLKTSYTLNDVLTELGMGDLFRSQADLSGISANRHLKVSEVVHQASLDVDETGVVAAASTAIRLIPLSFQVIPLISFDRPFMTVIVDTKTNTPLFIGKIVNPNLT